MRDGNCWVSSRHLSRASNYRSTEPKPTVSRRTPRNLTSMVIRPSNRGVSQASRFVLLDPLPDCLYHRWIERKGAAQS